MSKRLFNRTSSSYYSSRKRNRALGGGNHLSFVADDILQAILEWCAGGEEPLLTWDDKDLAGALLASRYLHSFVEANALRRLGLRDKRGGPTGSCVSELRRRCGNGWLTSAPSALPGFDVAWTVKPHISRATFMLGGGSPAPTCSRFQLLEARLEGLHGFTSLGLAAVNPVPFDPSLRLSCSPHGPVAVQWAANSGHILLSAACLAPERRMTVAVDGEETTEQVQPPAVPARDGAPPIWRRGFTATGAARAGAQTQVSVALLVDLGDETLRVRLGGRWNPETLNLSTFFRRARTQRFRAAQPGPAAAASPPAVSRAENSSPRHWPCLGDDGGGSDAESDDDAGGASPGSSSSSSSSDSSSNDGGLMSSSELDDAGCFGLHLGGWRFAATLYSSEAGYFRLHSFDALPEGLFSDASPGSSSAVAAE